MLESAISVAAEPAVNAPEVFCVGGIPGLGQVFPGFVKPSGLERGSGSIGVGYFILRVEGHSHIEYLFELRASDFILG